MKNKTESNLYFFYTVGCGWCKKVMPIIDELNKEGHDILKLDLAEKENKEIVAELKKKYNQQCGTPWFINAETGNSVCGFREKDILLKWINGEEIPAPPRPKGPMPRPPFFEAPKEEVTKWKEEYEKWADENSHMPNIKKADELLSMPRPRSQPPPPPRPGSTNEEQEKWKETYEKWAKENDHLPKVMPADQILQRINSQQQQAPQGQQASQGLDRRITSLEKKIDKLMNHLGVR